MSITPIKALEALDLIKGFQSTAYPTRKNFYDTFGISNCLLSCPEKRGLETNLTSITPDLAYRERRTNKIAYLQNLYENRTWFTAKNILKSASKGCGSCKVFCENLKTLYGNGEVSSEYEYFISHTFDFWARIPGASETDVMKIRLFQARGNNAPFQRMYEANILCGKETSLQRLLGWVDECTKYHDECSRNTQEDSSRPRRLIDVTPIQYGQKNGVKLIETSPGNIYEYTCLSHRWPRTTLDCKTTTDNLSDSLEFLELDQFPANFQDAVIITRQLKIRYVWIDSLCIIQEGDDKADWKRESAKMGSIYHNAYITIAAVWSPDSYGGCFPKENTLDVCFLLIDASGESHIIGARVLNKKGQITREKDAKVSYPLFTRGWVFQERMLSRRLLYCYDGEFSFECLKVTRCECSSTNLAPHARILGPVLNWLYGVTIKHRIQFNTRATSDKQASLQRWKEIVKSYMQLDLTVGTDILPAIAGCAQGMAPNFDYKYTAGMWKDSLTTELLWFILPSEKLSKPKPRQEIWTAPSWSWASVQPGQHLEFIFSRARFGQALLDLPLRQAIQDIICEPESIDNPYGPLKEGCSYLKLDAFLYHWYLRHFCSKQRYSRNNRNQNRRIFDFHHVRTGMPTYCIGNISELQVDDAEFDFKPDTPIFEEELFFQSFSDCKNDYKSDSCGLADIFLLHVLQASRKGTNNDVFLVLKGVPPISNKPNCYQRIGILTVSNTPSKRQEWFDQLKDKGGIQREQFWLF